VKAPAVFDALTLQVKLWYYSNPLNCSNLARGGPNVPEGTASSLGDSAVTHGLRRIARGLPGRTALAR